MWPVVERAVGFVLEWQQEGGELLWSIDPDGTPGRYALLTGSSSAYFSLRCAVACAEALGLERPDWELAIGRLRHAIAYRPDCFEPKRRYAMDWYYPVLSGALDSRRGARIDDRWNELVMEGNGVRCVADRPWVTVAETAECAMALLSLGRKHEAEQLLCWAQQQRREDGSYTTGLVYPKRHLPHRRVQHLHGRRDAARRRLPEPDLDCLGPLPRRVAPIRSRPRQRGPRKARLGRCR